MWSCMPTSPGNHAVTVKVEHLRILGHIRRRGIGHRLDLSLPENDRLIFARRSAGAVDHAHMRQDHDRRIDLHETAYQRRESLRRGNASYDQKQANNDVTSA